MTELWGTVTIDDVEVPVFVGTSRDHHVEAWRAIDRALQNKFWMFGAIAASLERTNGGRPLSRDETARLELGECETAIQRFIKSVGIGRQSFQQYNRTYRTFIGTGHNRLYAFHEQAVVQAS